MGILHTSKEKVDYAAVAAYIGLGKSGFLSLAPLYIPKLIILSLADQTPNAISKRIKKLKDRAEGDRGASDGTATAGLNITPKKSTPAKKGTVGKRKKDDAENAEDGGGLDVHGGHDSDTGKDGTPTKKAKIVKEE